MLKKNGKNGHLNRFESLKLIDECKKSWYITCRGAETYRVKYEWIYRQHIKHETVNNSIDEKMNEIARNQQATSMRTHYKLQM